jgi:hypothetical protein
MASAAQGSIDQSTIEVMALQRFTIALLTTVFVGFAGCHWLCQFGKGLRALAKPVAPRTWMRFEGESL